ncbi:MAG TPA: serine hydrolase domain-containing protein [Gemmatimonadaceae bacterium]|nr:serine hydrolase domain-containing protein [Gemmatimonadaceae bacterium]
MWLAVLASCGREPTQPVVSSPPPQQPETPITGAAVAGMGSFEQNLRALMQQYGIPGGAVAVVHDGKLFYARGFGYADVENEVPVQPDALFRIASVSKTITSVSILKLVEEGKLKLEDRVAPLIADLSPAPGATVDPRWNDITIQHLLNHTGGWDRAKPGGFDPIDVSWMAADAVGAPRPASSETLVRFMKGRPLDFNPGEQFAYSNFGFIILGRVIERVTGMKYEDFARTRVLLPVGATRTRQGKSRMADALPEEVKYYVPGKSIDAPIVPSIFPGEAPVPLNYGGYYLEAGDASGAWVSSTIDLLRFVNAVDGRDSPADILSPVLIGQMTAKGATVCDDGTCYYGDGWFVRPIQDGASWWHGGDLPCTKAMLVRSYTRNISWVALFNSAAPNSFISDVETALWHALNGMPSFAAQDLFPAFR